MGRLCIRTEFNFLLELQVLCGAEWRAFCRLCPPYPPTGGEGGHGTNFIEHYACRGTSLVGAANLSPVTKLVAGTGAVVSRRSEAESGVALQVVSEPEICQGAGF